MVGIHPNSPQNPHSAPASGGSDVNNIRTSPPEMAHVLYGAVVGGPRPNDLFWDWRDDWVQTEVALDYNANIPALAAYQVSTTPDLNASRKKDLTPARDKRLRSILCPSAGRHVLCTLRRTMRRSPALPRRSQWRCDCRHCDRRTCCNWHTGIFGLVEARLVQKTVLRRLAWFVDVDTGM